MRSPDSGGRSSATMSSGGDRAGSRVAVPEVIDEPWSGTLVVATDGWWRATDVTAASVAGGMATYAAFLSYFFAGIFALLAAAPLILGMKSIFDLSEKESEALVTGPLAVLWGLIVLAVWWVPLALTLPVAVHERRGPVSASVRSIALVAGRPRTALRHLAISYLLIVVLALIGLIVAVDGASAADAVAGLVISAIAVPLIAEALEGAYRALSGRDPAMVGE